MKVLHLYYQTQGTLSIGHEYYIIGVTVDNSNVQLLDVLPSPALYGIIKSMDNLIILLAVIAGYFMGNAHASTIATEKAAGLIETITKRNQIKVLHKREPKSTDDERAEQIAQQQGTNIPPNA